MSVLRRSDDERGRVPHIHRDASRRGALGVDRRGADPEPSPSYGHQKVVRNRVVFLSTFEHDGLAWEMLPGLGVKLSERSMPIRDVLICPSISITSHWCDDMIVAFEVLLPSSRSRDMRWKRHAYGAIPSLRHDVVLHQSAPDMRAFDRDTGWTERRATGANAALALPALDFALPARAIHAGTGLL